MKKLLIVFASLLSVLPLIAVAQNSQRDQPKSQDRITREVRHELLMLPYFGVFDNIAYKVDGSTVTWPDIPPTVVSKLSKPCT